MTPLELAIVLSAVDNASRVISQVQKKLEGLAKVGERTTSIGERNLTIPLSPFMTRRGVAKGTARDVISEPSAFGYSGTFFSAQLLFGRREDGSHEPLFKLQPSVTLSARPYAESALEEVAPQVESSIRHAMEALLK